MNTIQKLPAPTFQQRVETGIAQFGEDWPGVFIRGDNALHYAMVLRQMQSDGGDAFAAGVVNGLIELLASCDARLHQEGVVYSGHRGPDGAVVFKLVNGQPQALPLYTDHVNHSPTGFEWGYGGSGPAQLAYAMLYDSTHDRPLAERLHQRFKADVIAPITSNSFTMQQAVVRKWVNAARVQS